MVEKFNEDTRVKIPAAIHFLRLGYDYVSINEAKVNDVIEEDTNIFKDIFKQSLERINNETFADDDIEDILIRITQVVRNNDLGKQFYQWLINPQDDVKLIDFDNIKNNNFSIVCELPFKDHFYEKSFRPDINILINGIPLSFLEVKKPNNPGGIREEFNRMKERLSKHYFSRFFNMLQILSFSNNMEYEEVENIDDILAGSFYTTPNKDKTRYSFLREDDEKYIYNYNYQPVSHDMIREITRDCGYDVNECDSEEFKYNLKTTTPCNRFITSLYDKERLMYFIKYGIMYLNDRVPEKHIMRYPQFFASRKIVEMLDKNEKSGIIWHTQGSGKTALTAYANKIIKDYYAKKDTNTRFYFIVDRLDLLNQAEIEYTKRGFSVTTCDNREEFKKELNKPLSTNQSVGSIGEICVVNIQKFLEDMPKSSNDYGINVQRVFFIDEAHRSYSSMGTYFANLLSADTDAIYIALTGTPILSKKERTTYKFGGYIHKYFYDDSIADGYTLRIKKEKVDTQVKRKLRNELKIVDDTDLDNPKTFESSIYISSLGEYIEKDFIDFRESNYDNTVGAMVVCKTNPQAKLMYEWFKKHSNLKTGLVISNEDGEQDIKNKSNQLNFRNKNNEESLLDLLVVNKMLTTGYDVDRLKKLYLLRGPKAHSLLQTISRVNRPYKAPTGLNYKYGYVVDFVDIATEYDATLQEYIKELEKDYTEFGESSESIKKFIVDTEYIYDDFLQQKAELDKYNLHTNNAEIFSQEISIYNKDTLYKIRKNLEGMKSSYIELLRSGESNYYENIDFNNIKKLLKVVQYRIDYENTKDKPLETIIELPIEDLGDIIIEFIKVKESILNPGNTSAIENNKNKLRDIIEAFQVELKDNKNKEDPQINKLNDWMKEIFEKLKKSDLSNLEEIVDEAVEVLAELKRINKENNQFIDRYQGNSAYLKTYNFVAVEFGLDNKSINCLLDIIYKNLPEDKNEIMVTRGRNNFIKFIQKNTASDIFKIKDKNEDLFNIIYTNYTPILNEFFTNLKTYEEGLKHA